MTVSTGPDHSCAVSASAGLHCWGNNDKGQLGDATPVTVPVTTPSAIALPGATAVAVGLSSTSAIANEQLYGWGESSDGALGDPITIDPAGPDLAVPTLASGLTGWTTVSAAEALSCGTRGDEVWCWGRSRGGGGMGNGVWNSTSGSSQAKYFGQVITGVTDLS